jgi:phosphatidate cytidylyltransferase
MIIGSLFLGEYAFGAVFLLILLLALYEFYDLAFASGASPFSGPGLFAGAIVFIITFLVSSGITGPRVQVLIFPLMILLIIIALYSLRTNIINSIAVTLLGILYVSFPLATMNYLVFPASNSYVYTHRIVLGILTLVWINDTGAYIIGISIGHHRLFPRISPKKSWEGAIGGTFLTLLAALWMKQIMGMLTQTNWIVIAAIVSVFGVYGDLAESLFKRSVNIKDSGTVIPGHGGMLDRIDSILFAMPMSFVYLMLNKL